MIRAQLLKLLRITAHVIGVSVSALGGYLLALVLMALIPGGGPYGESWIFRLQIALFFLLPPVGALAYIMFALRRNSTTSNRLLQPTGEKRPAAE